MTRSNITSKETGVALIITLALLAIASILVVGFTASMRTERQASISMASNQTAEILAHSAVDHAAALLKSNIPAPLPPGIPPSAQNWSVAPGCLFVWNAATASYTTIPLSSGDPGSSDPELNITDSTANQIIVNGNTSIKAAWVNVMADPSQPANGTALTSSGAPNQIVGRYAFWIDDENSKININTAYGRPDRLNEYTTNVVANANSYIYGVPSFEIPLTTNPGLPSENNPYSLGHPSCVGLDTSIFTTTGTVDRDSLWNDHVVNSPYRAFATAGEISNYVTGDTAFYQKNKFWLTQRNGDPEFNAFGKSRIFFTDSTFQPSYTQGNPHLTYPGSDGFTYVPEPSQTTGAIRDLTEPLTFHVDANDVTVTGLQDTPTQNAAVAAVQQIASYLNMKWPGYNHSFVEKWSIDHINADTQGKREAQQVAWNLWGMAANAASGSATMTGTPPSNSNMNGIWGNQIKTFGLTKPGWANYLFNGPQLDGTWPASRILPEVRAARIPRFAISFIATQRNRTNGGTVSGATGSHYVVNVRLWPQTSLPRGLQGLEQLTEAWNPGTQSEEIYITHFEATINDQSGATPVTVTWSSEAPNTAPPNCLYWDSAGRTNLYKFPGRSIALIPDGQNYGFRSSQTAWDFSTVDNTVGVNPSPRSINIPVFTRPASGSNACLITNVRLRFVVAAGTGSNETPTQISPMRDIDGATGYEVSHTQDSTVVDSGSISIPGPISIPTGSLASTQPDYWVAVETLDPRVNIRGTPTTGPTTSDDWQLWTAGTPLTGSSTTFGLPAQLADNTRNTRFVYSTNNDSAYPQVSNSSIPQSGDGDESKCAWIDTSNYTQKTPSQVQRRMWGSMPGMISNRMPSIGMISCISTGIQTGVSWRTIKLQPTAEDPPDWLLLDLFAIPYNSIANIATMPDAIPVPLTLMNSTVGKININTAVFLSSTNSTTSIRNAAVKGLFLNSYRPNVVAATSTLVNASAAQSYNNINSLYTNIASYLANKSSPHFDYAGEICQVSGISDNSSGGSAWEREALVRQLASLITTRSNTFSVWGVAQTLKKIPGHTQYGVFENGDQVTGEKRFHAIVQRYVWPGVDNSVGNGQTTGSPGSYSQLGATAKLGSTTNIIDYTDPTNAAFYTAFNPGAAVVKDRVVFFEYLN